MLKGKTEEESPKIVVCGSNNGGTKPKLTKTNFREALKEIVLEYKTNDIVDFVLLKP